MSTETTESSHATASNGQRRGAGDQGGSVNWADFFAQNGWVDGDKIHCPDEFIFEMRFVDGFSLVVYPPSGGGDSEMAPTILHGVLTFKQGTDHFYYPWGMLASLVTKLNPRRTKKVQGREYAVDAGADYERRIKNTADLVIEPPHSDSPKTVVGTVHTPETADAAGKRQFSGMDANSTSWSAGGSENHE